LFAAQLRVDLLALLLLAHRLLEERGEAFGAHGNLPPEVNLARTRRFAHARADIGKREQEQRGKTDHSACLAACSVLCSFR
jgi:hypothetical protein